MAYALDRRLPLGSATAGGALDEGKPAADVQRHWRQLSAEGRWALARAALGIAA